MYEPQELIEHFLSYAQKTSGPEFWNDYWIGFMICVLFPFLAVWKGLYRQPVYHLPLAPVMARSPSSERALRREPSYQLLLCFICPLLWCVARVSQLIIQAARDRQPISWLSALFAPVMALGPSSELALRRRPRYHLPFVSFAHLYGAAWAGQLIVAFLLNFPRYGARPKRASLSLPYCSI